MNAVKLNKQDAASIRAVELINELFAIDAQARNENMDHAARQALRHEKAPPLLDEIRTSHPGDEQDGAAQERRRPGMQLHTGHLEETDPLPRLPRTGTEHQSRREFDEAYRRWQKKLDPHRE